MPSPRTSELGLGSLGWGLSWAPRLVPSLGQLLALAQLSSTAGIGGCVCSPLEVAALRAQHPEPFALVTPGIRPKGEAVGDQARVMGPAEALAAGASQLVIGRPITKAEDPSAAFAACCAELLG